MNYGGGGGFDTTNLSPQDNAKARKSYGDQTATPVTIHQIHSARTDSSGGPDSSVVLADGRPLTLCKLVCAVRSMEEQSTNISFTVEDGTGLIVAKQWIDVNDAGQASAIEEMKTQCQDHVYVRIIGSVREYDSKRVIMANSIRKVSTANELTHHMLEVVHTHLGYKKGSMLEMGNFGAAPQMMQQGYGGAGSALQAQQGGGNELSELILEVMRNSIGDISTGIHKDEIIRELKGRYSAQDVMNAMADMTNDGLVYSTIDDSHFCYC